MRYTTTLAMTALLLTACGRPAMPNNPAGWPAIAAWHRLNTLRNYAFRSSIRLGAHTTAITTGRYHNAHNYAITRSVVRAADTDTTSLLLATNQHYYTGPAHQRVDILINNPKTVGLRASVLSYTILWALYLRTSRGTPAGSCHQAGRPGQRFQISVLATMVGSACIDKATGAMLAASLRNRSGGRAASFAVTCVGGVAAIPPPLHPRTAGSPLPYPHGSG